MWASTHNHWKCQGFFTTSFFWGEPVSVLGYQSVNFEVKLRQASQSIHPQLHKGSLEIGAMAPVQTWKNGWCCNQRHRTWRFFPNRETSSNTNLLDHFDCRDATSLCLARLPKTRTSVWSEASSVSNYMLLIQTAFPKKHNKHLMGRPELAFLHSRPVLCSKSHE